MSKAHMPIYQIKITLKDVQPPIWRRFLVSSDITLAKFHRIIQNVMGWTNSHLHMFKVGVVRFTEPYDSSMLAEMTAIDSRKVKLTHIVPHVRPFRGEFHFEFGYEYDFGDGWMHEIIFEDVLPPDPTQKTPICLDGARACPPEDMGGVWGYHTFLEAIKNPQHPEHEMYTEWIDGEFDPEAFDLDAVNKALRSFK